MDESHAVAVVADATPAGGIELGRPEWRRRVDAFGRRWLPQLQFGADAVAWCAALFATTFLRYDMRIGPVNEVGVVVASAIAVVLQAVIGASLGLYRRRFHYGSFEEVRVVAASMAIVAMAVYVVDRVQGGTMIPRSVPFLAFSAALVLASVVRYLARLVEEQHLRPSEHSAAPLVVLGAGQAGAQIIRTLLRTPESPYRPVALLDDDPRKARFRLSGLAVRGTAEDAVATAERYGASTILVAIPSITGDRLRQLSAPLQEAGIQVLVLPPVAELLGTLRPSDIRPLTVVDLMGRHPADVDPASIAGYVTGRRVLVTGAGGSIGSELCRQLRRFEPAALIMLDRDESGLHSTELSLEGRALLESPNLVLADIRDRDRVFEVFQQHRPEVVFHAAALKHLPLLEFNPTEAWKTNVVGTRNVLEAAEATNVAGFVNVSTDKAADPASVLGFTKRICERLTADTARLTRRPYVSVRFGNVLGSRGSMLGVFEQQVAAGGPVTVTHQDITRFFMTVEEAVALTIQAGALGEPGEVLVLDMGAPVRIQEVAERLAAQAGITVEFVYTGLRPGEKLHEVLLGADEDDSRPRHDLISQVPVPPMSFEAARAACSVDGRLLLSHASLDAAASWGLPASAPASATPSTMMGGHGGAHDEH